jgi:hypothetical protein
MLLRVAATRLCVFLAFVAVRINCNDDTPSLLLAAFSRSRVPGSNGPNPAPVGANTQMRLPADMALSLDAGFRVISTSYANSLAVFNTAFANAFGA